MEPKSIHKFSDILKSYDITTESLGAVMLPLDPIDLWSYDGSTNLDKDDLYTSDNPDRFWVKGDVTDKLHVTLLYGLLKPAYEDIQNIDKVLDEWERPKEVPATDIISFPSPYNDENYCAIVAKLNNVAFDQAHARLSYLPHLNTFPKYQPHATLAYVKSTAAIMWTAVLRNMNLRFTVDQTRLDYGSEK